MALRLFNMIINTITQLIFHSNFWIFFSVSLLINIFQNGLGYVPAVNHVLMISKDIYSNPFVGEPTIHFLLYSFLGPVLAFFTDLNKSIFSYSLMHFALFIFFFSGLIFITRKKFGDCTARVLMILFVLSPVSKVVENWLGYPDGFTLLISIGIVLFRNNLLLVGVLAFLQGINHFEQGFIIIILILIFDFISDRKSLSLKFALSSLSGVVIGRIVLDKFFWLYNFEIAETRLLYLFRNGIGHYLSNTFSNPPALLFSLFNLIWIFLIIYIVLFKKTSRVKALLISISIAFIPTVLSLDQTRIFSLLSFPILLLIIIDKQFIQMGNTNKGMITKALAILFSVGFFIPRIIIFDGKLYSSAYSEMYTWLFQLFFS